MTAADIDSERFEALWRRCIASPPAASPTEVRDRLRGLLGSPNRHFHNLDHIRDCLRRADEVASLLADRDAVEMALWFHDAVYEPGDSSNERRSAELFLSLSVGARPAFRRRVCELILTTRHCAPPRGCDRRFIDDIDLAGFGAPWDEFMRQGALLRKEFSMQTDAEYHRGQLYFLRMLAQRPTFFASDYFRDRYETAARDNLRRLLALLGDAGVPAPGAA